MRRFFQASAGCSAAPHLLRSSLCFSTEPKTEAERETLLRQCVLKRYPEMRPPVSELQYGSFAREADPGYPRSRSLGGRFLLFVLGSTALIWMVTKNAFKKERLAIPLWTSSVCNQAKHIIFQSQYDKKVRDSMSVEFVALRQANPFLDYFQWVATKCPDFCMGYKYDSATAIGIVTQAMAVKDSPALISALSTKKLSNRDARQRVDDLVDALTKINTFRPFSSPVSPFVPQATLPLPNASVPQFEVKAGA